ncbi:TolB family protein [Bhargavaea ullalensis]
MKRPLLIVLLLIGLATAASAAAGFVLQKPEDEREEGLSEVYDVSADGTVAYVSYTEGSAGIYLLNREGQTRGPLAGTESDSRIADLSFSPDGSALFFAVNPKDRTTGLKSTVRKIDLKSGSDTGVYQDGGLITELAFSLDDPGRIYFLRAGVFENYSPVAAAHPHDFDVHELELSDRSTRALTELKAYDMRSINIPEGSDSVFFTMFGEDEAEFAEETFEATQQIYRAPKTAGEAEKAGTGFPQDVYDFLVLPDGRVIYQTVAKTSNSGLFEYELFIHEPTGGKDKQLTRTRTYAGKPVISADGQTLWFIEDRNFGGGRPDYFLYRMPLEGGAAEQVLPAL